MFGYHGSNYTGRMMRQYLDNEKPPLLDGTIFVYPDGLPLPNQPNSAWVLTEGERDLVFFDTLLARPQTTYCIDQSRILVNGQSFGGLMTNAVGCLRGDVVRAIAVVAGPGRARHVQGAGSGLAHARHRRHERRVLERRSEPRSLGRRPTPAT